MNQPLQVVISRRFHQALSCLRVNHGVAHVGFSSNCGEPSPLALGIYAMHAL
jgi:hypothetical protein